MRILFVGGTQFVGRAMATAASSAGHDVTLLHRGHSDDPEFTGIEQLTADRDVDLSALEEREFDATIDVCAYVPRHVKQLAEALDGRGGHHVLISTMSVYADADAPGLTEDSKLVRLHDTSTEDVTGETYGGLKVLCEEAAQSAYDDDALTIIRPTYVVGPHDHTGRFTWWIRRIARGGEVLAPGPRDAPVQVIDARDQAAWVVGLTEQGRAGIFNSVSPSPPFGFGDLLDATVRAVGPGATTLTWADAGWLADQGENYQSLPLWSEGDPAWVLAADPGKAMSSGLAPRPLTQTIKDTWDWIQRAQPPLVEGWGVSSDRELELLALWHARGR
ncbi:MAG: NAD-dependent epimerase/dehydratase family protein [Nocardioidaceae bacterium]